MSLSPPTLLYPNGGETVSTPTLTIRWDSTNTTDADGRPLWVEVFATEEYRPEGNTDWVAVATLPASVTSFVWRLRRGLNGDRFRVAVRYRNSVGTRSQISSSAADFTVGRKKVRIPQLLSPVSGGRYDNSIRIELAPGDEVGRSYYQFFYSSTAAAVPKTPLAPRVPAAALPFTWLTAELPPADDYILHVSIVAGDGTELSSAEVGNVRISHEGYFIVDTLPPEVTVRLASPTQFTRFRNVGLKVYSHDEATGARAMMLKDAGGDGRPQLPKVVTTFKVNGIDGVKKVQAVVEDYGANLNNDGEKRPLLGVLPLEDSDVVDFVVSLEGDDEVVHFVTRGEHQGLYRLVDYARRVRTLDDEPTAVAVFADDVYVAAVDDDRKGIILKSVTDRFVTVYEFTETDSYATCMGVLEDRLFLGTSDGRLLELTGDTVDEIATLGNGAVSSVGADASALYLAVENDTNVFLFNGDTVTEVGA
jgi:hypothetical protein